MRVASFLHEVKRRKVFQVAAVYAVTAWLLVQVVVAIKSPLKLPVWADTFVIVLLAIGFPVALILSWAFDLTPDGIQPTRRTRPQEEPTGVPWAALTYVSQGLVLLAVGYLVLNEFLVKSVTAPTGAASEIGELTRYRYELTNAERLVATPSVSLAVSPDGQQIVYVGPGADDVQLWTRRRDQLVGTPIPGTEGASAPFFAPDGAGLAFITAKGALKVVSRDGDAPRTVVKSGLNTAGGSWGPDGFLYFSTSAGLARQRATGGEQVEIVAARDPADADIVALDTPDVLPNGAGVLFTVSRNHVPSEIALLDLGTHESRVLTRGELARYAPSGHLVYVREDGALLAATFDEDRLEMTGSPVLLEDKLPSGTPPPDLAISPTGRMVYATREERTLKVGYVDRAGQWEPIDPTRPLRGVRYVALSPDDRRLAVTTWLRPPGDDGQLWIKELPNGPLDRFSFEGQVNMRPSWTPDGRDVVFISDRGTNRDVWRKRGDGSGAAELVLDDVMPVDEAFFSRDGSWIVHRRGMQNGQRDILAVRSDGSDGARPIVASDFDEVAPALSPNGHWLAYVSNRAGQDNVYIRPFPEADAETLVSVSGGREPVWSRNGAELFYRNGTGRMIARAVLDAESLELGPEQQLFDARAYRSDFYHAAYDATADGQRFVMIRLSDSGSLDESLVVVENWFDELRGIVPAP